MLESQKRTEIDTWIDAICEDRIDPSGMARLDALLKDDPDVQAYYLRQIDLFHALRWHVASRATWQSVADLKAAGFDPTQLPKPQATSQKKAARWGWWVAVAAAVLAMVWFANNKNQPRPEVVERPKAPVAVPKQPDEFPVPVPRELAVATVVDQQDAVWEGHDAVRELPAGPVRLARGIAHLKLINEVSLSIAGPAELTLIDGTRCRLQRGTMTVAVPPWAQGFAVEAAGVKITDLGTEFGISVDADQHTKVAVFRGEVEARVDSEYLGMVQTLRLTREEGMEVDPQGAVTTSIIGDDRRFAALRQLPALTVPTLANGSFEYPRTDSYTTAAAAGWKLLSHPLNNADLMQARAGIVETGHRGVVAGQAPEPPHGRQWAYLTANTFADGRTAYSTMHQAVGLVAAEATYRLRFTVAFPQGQPPVDYTAGLYAGSNMDGPVIPLKVWRTPASPAAGQSAEITLTYVSPKRTSYRGDELYVMFQAVPQQRTGECQVLFDNVQLELVDDSSPQKR